MDSENSESKKTAEWVLEFEVGVNKDNLRRVRECLNRNQEPADSLNSVKLGQVISFKLVFQTESSPEIQIFSEMFNSESATGWEFCFEEEEKNRFLEIKFNFRILEETASLFARYYNSSINIQDEKIRKNELEEFLGELLPGPVAKKIAVSENYDEANLFKTAGIGRPHLTVSTINEEGETEPEKLILNPYFGLKQEEGAILDRNRRFFEKSFEAIEKICAWAQMTAREHLPKDPAHDSMEQRLKSRRQVLFSHALLPTAFQHYNGIISLLKKGQKITAACIYRAFLEMYFDVLYLHFHPELTFRFLDYEIVHRKWCMDALKMYYPKIIIPEGEKKLVGMYNEFTQKYSIKESRELSTWTGLSVLKMVKQVFRSKSGFVERLYSDYLYYSAFIHLSSSANDILHRYIGATDEVENQFVDRIFYESVFDGWNVLMESVFLCLDTLDAKPPVEKLDRLMECHNEKEKIEADVHQWQKIKRDFYGEEGAMQYNPWPRDFVQYVRDDKTEE